MKLCNWLGSGRYCRAWRAIGTGVNRVGIANNGALSWFFFSVPRANQPGRWCILPRSENFSKFHVEFYRLYNCEGIIKYHLPKMCVCLCVWFVWGVSNCLFVLMYCKESPHFKKALLRKYPQSDRHCQCYWWYLRILQINSSVSRIDVFFTWVFSLIIRAVSAHNATIKVTVKGHQRWWICSHDFLIEINTIFLYALLVMWSEKYPQS